MNNTTSTTGTSTKAAASQSGNISTVKKLVFIAILGAVSFLLFLFNFPIPLAPSFMKFDLAEIPALFAGFFMGPIAGFCVVAIRVLLKIVIQGSDTAFVGELSNLIGSFVFVGTAAVIYKMNRTKKGAVIASIIATLAVSIFYVFLNLYVMFPLYSRLYGMPLDAIISMGTAINPRIVSLPTMMLFSVLPFNLVKHAVTDLVTFLIYKRAGSALRKLLYS